MTETQKHGAPDPLSAERIDAQEQKALLDALNKRVSAFAFWFVFCGIVLMVLGLHFTGYLEGAPKQQGEPDALPPLAVFGIATTAAFFPMWGYVLGSRIGWWLYKK